MIRPPNKRVSWDPSMQRTPQRTHLRPRVPRIPRTSIQDPFVFDSQFISSLEQSLDLNRSGFERDTIQQQQLVFESTTNNSAFHSQPHRSVKGRVSTPHFSRSSAVKGGRGQNGIKLFDDNDTRMSMFPMVGHGTPVPPPLDASTSTRARSNVPAGFSNWRAGFELGYAFGERGGDCGITPSVDASTPTWTRIPRFPASANENAFAIDSSPSAFAGTPYHNDVVTFGPHSFEPLPPAVFEPFPVAGERGHKAPASTNSADVSFRTQLMRESLVDTPPLSECSSSSSPPKHSVFDRDFPSTSRFQAPSPSPSKVSTPGAQLTSTWNYIDRSDDWLSPFGSGGLNAIAVISAKSQAVGNLGPDAKPRGNGSNAIFRPVASPATTRPGLIFGPPSSSLDFATAPANAQCAKSALTSLWGTGPVPSLAASPSNASPSSCGSAQESRVASAQGHLAVLDELTKTSPEKKREASSKDMTPTTSNRRMTRSSRTPKSIRSPFKDKSETTACRVTTRRTRRPKVANASLEELRAELGFLSEEDIRSAAKQDIVVALRRLKDGEFECNELAFQPECGYSGATPVRVHGAKAVLQRRLMWFLFHEEVDFEAE